MSRQASRFGAKPQEPSRFFLSGIPLKAIALTYLCYMDESGTPSIPGNTSHFVLVGLSIPISRWRDADKSITKILGKCGLENEDLHTAWVLRSYFEQSRIANFDELDWDARRAAVRKERNKYLLHLQQTHQSKSYRQFKKMYRHTDPYVHLTR